jgi:tetratricopeptide (TPR) repeat protein
MVVLFLVSSEVACQTRAQDQVSLDGYIATLERIQQRWQQAAALVYENDAQQGLQLLHNDYPSETSRFWNERGYSLLRRLLEKNNIGANSADMARWYFNMDRPDLAAMLILQVQPKAEQFDLSDRVLFSQALIEAGLHEESIEAMVELKKVSRFTGDDQWSTICDRWIDAIRSLQDEQDASIEFYERVYLDPNPRWYCERLHPIVSVWQLSDPNNNNLRQARFLGDYFARAGDRTGQELAYSWIIQNANDAADREAIAEAMIQLGSLEFEKAKSAAALRWWEKVKEQYHDTLSAGAAEQKIRGLTLMSRARARWSTANGLFAKKDYSRALKAYRAFRETHLSHYWWGRFVCGNAVAQKEYEVYFREAVCLEHLGDYDQAVEAYWQATTTTGFHSRRTAHIRLVDLYESANQIEALETMVRSRDEHSEQTISQLLEIRAMGANRDWRGLIELLRSDNVSLPHERTSVTRPWKPFEAARILAENHQQTVPLLRRQLDGTAHDKMIFYTLGSSASGAAVAILKEAACRETDSYRLRDVIYSLSLADAPGEAAINELAKSATGRLKATIEQYRNGNLGPRHQDTDFPDIPSGLILPRNLGHATAAGK